MIRIGFWAGSKYNLSRMTMRDLVRAYFTHYAVVAYFVLAAVCLALTFAWMPAWTALDVARVMGAGVAAMIVYPAVWYILHRWVLHSRVAYRSPLTAKVWKRTHFDHHQDPHNLGVLFGALYTTLPTIAIVTLPLGWLIGGPAGAAACVAGALLTTCFYEFCHSAQHLNYRPKQKWMQEIKRLHLLHHFHNENGNYGITNFVVDRVLRTGYDAARDRTKSPTVFNLGYDETMAAKYPWVAALSTDGIRVGADGRRWKPHTPHASADAIGADLGYGGGGNAAQPPRDKAA
ncbi:sterol desaturase family protein [Reyranella sp. CPCC 100927]|uniref:sterol desaturase family protein n=1 Tax=Reyranella sp. CPCC 100927 TaxID=2599616 RepID=UPI001C49A422|nr:sterol desaturase family protein [Reyranella sp. CPCC 100927]